MCAAICKKRPFRPSRFFRRGTIQGGAGYSWVWKHPRKEHQCEGKKYLKCEHRNVSGDKNKNSCGPEARVKQFRFGQEGYEVTRNTVPRIVNPDGNTVSLLDTTVAILQHLAPYAVACASTIRTEVGFSSVQAILFYPMRWPEDIFRKRDWHKRNKRRPSTFCLFQKLQIQTRWIFLSWTSHASEWHLSDSCLDDKLSCFEGMPASFLRVHQRLNNGVS